MSFGPGNAFGAFAPSVARPPRRVNSSGSFKEDNNKVQGVPTPMDHPSNPSFGSWADRERENSAGSNHANTPSAAQQQAATEAAQRSFSSILSPTLPTTNSRKEEQDPLAKPFVYSREFLLSLYDDDKARRRPIELAVNEIATKDQGNGGGKPWALRDMRDGEKELFAQSIHPPASRVRSQHGQARNGGNVDSNGHGGGAFGASPSLAHREIPGRTGGGGDSNTLDLGSLGALPRERDRALASPGGGVLGTPIRGGGNGSIASPILSSAEKERDLAAARRARVGGNNSGILGGVLGGIGRSPTLAAAGIKKEILGGAGGKDVWQGGRWRRQGRTQEEAEVVKRPTAFGARRFPTNDDLLASPSSSRPGTPVGRDSASASASDGVRAAWDDDEDDSSVPASAGQQSRVPSPPAQTQSRFAKQQQEQADEPDLTHHASSILGSLALDSDPTDDPLAHSSSSASGSFNNTAPTAPPGLSTPAAVNLAEQTWQYRDPSGQIQGPFAAPMMHSWYGQHFFSSDLRVRRTQEREFETLENLIRRSGDPDTPFLTAPLQPVATLPPPATTTANQDAAGGWPLGPSTPLDQFSSAAGGGGQRAFGSFYEPFGAAPSASSSSAFEAPGQQAHSAFGFAGQQSRQGSSQGGGLDPWGAPLPVASPAAAAPWNEQPNLFSSAAGGAYGQQQQQQQPFAQASPAFAHQQQPHSPFQQHQQQSHHQQQQNPVDIFRQLTQQQQQQPHGQQPQQFFDPASAAGHPQDWRQAPPQQQQQLGQQHPQQQQQSWSSLLPSRLDNLVGAGSPALSPIGPPSAQQSPAVAFAQQPTPAPVSPWGAVAPVVEQPTPAPSAPVVKEEQQQLPPPIAAPKEFAAIGKPVVEKVVKEQVREKEARAASSKKEVESTPAAAPVKEEPVVSAAPSPSPSPAPKSSAAPWSAPVSSAPATPSGPSLREIQEVEAREADKRKAAARVQAAQANIQAAQRIAAQEAAEQLPASVQWATGGSSAPVAAGATAPWSKPAAAGKVAGGKTLKEIQEEEERRKKAQAAQAALTSAPAAGVRGYAGSIGQMAAAKANSGPSWTTVAVKPAAVPSSAPPARPLIPGLGVPSSASSTTTRSASLPVKPVAPTPAPVVAAVRPAAPVATASASSIIRSVAVNGVSSTRANGQQYDAENPPPPSGEFLKWCKDALQGLTVPSMDEFIHMLLSFPLDASPDVLEIISDSVYANSSTLDGRRFANEFVARRKMDVAARFPQLVMSKTVNRVGGGKPTSMAEALKSQPVAKTPEWSVKVAGGKKKGKK